MIVFKKWRIQHMSSSWIAALLYAAPACVAAAQGQVGQHTVTTDAGLVSNTAKSYSGIGIPDQINPIEIERYGQLLRLSNEQHVLLARLFEAYLVADNQLKASRLQELWDQAGEIGTVPEFRSSLAGAQAIVDLIEGVEHELQPIEQIENAIWIGIAPALTEEQKLRLTLVKNLRQRTLTRSSQPAMFPGNRFDIVVELHEVIRALGDLLPNEDAAVMELLLRYDAAFTDLEKERWQGRMNGVKKGLVLQARLQQSISSGTEAERAALNEEYQPLKEKAARVGRKIYDLNRQYLVLLTAQIPSRHGQLLNDKFNRSTYPPIYPNPFALDSVVDRLGKIEKIVDERRALIDALVGGYHRATAILENDMIDYYMDWKERTAIRRGYAHADYDEYKARMQEFQRARKTNSDNLIRSLTEALQPEELALVQPEIEKWNKSVEPVSAALAVPNRDWPLPYE